MRPYTEGLLDRYRIGIPRELSEIHTQPWRSQGSLTCDPCHHRGLDSPAVDPRLYPGSGEILMSEKSQAVYYISMQLSCANRQSTLH